MKNAEHDEGLTPEKEAALRKVFSRRVHEYLGYERHLPKADHNKIVAHLRKKFGDKVVIEWGYSVVSYDE